MESRRLRPDFQAEPALSGRSFTAACGSSARHREPVRKAWLTVSELRISRERLLTRLQGKPPADDEALKLLYERASLPDRVSWIERNRDRAATLRNDEILELLEMQAPGGTLEKIGVESWVDLIERRRRLVGQVKEIAGTEFLELLEQLVRLMYDKVKPRGVEPERNYHRRGR